MRAEQTPSNFEELLAKLKSDHRHGSFSFGGAPGSIRHVVMAEFRDFRPAYGVYVVRAENSEILYVGKGGTINQQGKFKSQDIPGRLINVRTGDVSADKWLQDVITSNGPLTIEYVLLPDDLSPGFVETLLLQAYFNDHKRLPVLNRSL